MISVSTAAFGAYRGTRLHIHIISTHPQEVIAMSQPRSFEFQLIPAHGSAPFHHSRSDELHPLLKVRLPSLTNLGYKEGISEEDLRRGHGYVEGAEPPALLLLTVELDDYVSREKVRAGLQAALSDMGRPDITVANA